MTIKQVKAAILMGQLDDSLHQLIGIVKMRQKYVAEIKRDLFTEGDRVVFNGAVKPASLAGQTGRIAAFHAKFVTVEIVQGANSGETKDVAAHMLDEADDAPIAAPTFATPVPDEDV